MTVPTLGGPKKKKVVTVEESETGPDEKLDVFTRAKDQFGGSSGVILQVFRSNRGEDKAFLEQHFFDGEVHTADFVRDRYGAGRYTLRFLTEDSKYLFAQTLMVGSINPASDTTTAGTAGFDPMQYLIAQQSKSQGDFKDLVLALLAKGSGGGGSSEGVLEMVKAMSAQNNTILTAILSRPGGNSVEPVFKALEAGLRVATDIKTDTEGSWIGLLRGLARDLLPVVQDYMATQKVAAARGNVVSFPSSPALPGVPAQPAAAFPTPPPAPPTVTPGPPADVSSAPFDQVIQTYAPTVLQWAKDGRSPEEAAGEILDNVGVVYHPLFDSLTAHHLTSFVPELEQLTWNNPSTGESAKWVQVFVDLLHKRDWGGSDVETGSDDGGEGLPS